MSGAGGERVSAFTWLNDQRLLYSTDGRSLWAVDRDGGLPRRLAPEGVFVQALHALPSDPDHLLVAQRSERSAYPDLYRVHSISGRRQLRHQGPRDGFPERWFFTPDGELRAAELRTPEGLRLAVFDPETNRWSRLQTQPAYGTGLRLAQAPVVRGEALAVTAGPVDPMGRRTTRLARLNLGDGRMGPVKTRKPLYACCETLVRPGEGDLLLLGGHAPDRFEPVLIEREASAILTAGARHGDRRTDGRTLRPISVTTRLDHWILIAESSLLEPNYFTWSAEAPEPVPLASATETRQALARHRANLPRHRRFDPDRRIVFDMTPTRLDESGTPSRVDVTSSRSVTSSRN